MRRPLLLVLLLLAAGASHAGAYFRGVCYPDKTAAAQAFCLEAALPQPFGTLSTDFQQSTTTVGRDLYARAHGIVTAACSIISLGAGDTVSVTHSLNWRSQLVSQAATVGTGYTFPAPVTTASNYTFGGAAQTVSNTLTFPACTTGDYASSTPADGVELGFLAGGAPLAVACALYLVAALRRES